MAATRMVPAAPIDDGAVAGRATGGLGTFGRRLNRASPTWRGRATGLLPGARARRAQVVEFAARWRQLNEAAVEAGGPVWVVLGDSTAQAIGASSFVAGYVGQVLAWLSERDGTEWGVRNLSRSGAVAADVVAEQLSGLAEVPSPALVSCAIGANDLLRRPSRLVDELATVASGLPPGALLANLPRGLRERRAREVNRSVVDMVAAHDLRLVDLWATTGPPWRGKFSADQFHPNDVGYRDWTRAFVTALG